MALFESTEKTGVELPIGLGKGLDVVVAAYRKRDAIRMEGRTWSYAELDEQATRIAGGLQALGILKGDRVAMMLPNIPEFVFSFFGIQKLGAVAVPFNTTYKGREISYILQNSGSRAIICLSSFANLISEIRPDCSELEHVITTGDRTLVYVDPDATVNVQMVMETGAFKDADDAFHLVGEALVDTFHGFGVTDAWYKHQGAVRARGKKLAVMLLREIEGLYIFNIVTYLQQMDTSPLFKVVYVPPEIRERALEPMTSIQEQTGSRPTLDEFRTRFLESLSEELGVSFGPGELTRDEVMAYEKNRALATKI